MRLNSRELQGLMIQARARDEEWRATGRAFGYPECCISWFIDEWSSTCEAKHFQGVDLSADPLFTWFRESSPIAGYIPCPVCAVRFRLTSLKEGI